MDEMTKNLCGDHGNSDSASETLVYHDEDSMDIYAGLEDSPEKNTNTGKAFRSLVSPGQSESMDLFEEIIVEEHLKKEASYNEMKTKFEDSRSQLQELFQKLQQLETQNVSLQTENTLLKKNICALMKTARSEIDRKDTEINRLSERTGRGSGGPKHHQPQPNQHSQHTTNSHNQQHSHAATRGSCTGDDRPASFCQSHHERPNHSEKVVAKNPPFTPPSSSSSSSSSLSSLSSTQLSTVKDVSVPCNCIDKPVNNYSNTSDPLEFGNQHLLGHGSSDPETTASSSADSRGQNDKERKKDSQMVPSSTKSDQNHSAHSSRPSKTQYSHSTDMLASVKSKVYKGTKPQRHKSPPQHHGTSEKSKQSSNDFSENLSYLGKSRDCREVEAFNESQWSWHSIRSESSRVSSRHRRGKSPTRDHHRTEERWKECASRESRSTRSDKSRDHERKSREHEKERSRRNRESTSKSERQEAGEKVPVRKLDAAEGRAVTFSVRPDNRQYFSYHKRAPRKNSEDERRQPTEKLVDTRDEKTNDNASSESHTSKNAVVGQETKSNFSPLSKESVREGSGTKKNTKKVKLTKPNHTKTNLSSPEHASNSERQRQSDRDACQAKDAVISEAVARDERASEESSPNRKLSFMETLNLTLSPQKKPNQLSECKTLNRESAKDGVCSPSSLERTDPIDPTGEQFYVIDEFEASVEESHVNEKMLVSLNSSEKDNECCSKTSAQEVENPVPDDIEMQVKTSSVSDSLKAINAKDNVECILPTPAADEKAVVTTETSTPHLISHEEDHCVTNSIFCTTESVTIIETDIDISFSPVEEAVIESTLNTDKASTSTAEPATLDFPGGSAENGEEKASDTMTALSLCSGMLQDETLSIMPSKMYTAKEVTPVKGSICMDSVSSTVNLKASPSCPSSCAVRLDVPEVSKMETEWVENGTSHGPLKEQINEVPDVSSTSRKDSVLQEKVVASSSETPAQQAQDAEPDSTENAEHNTEPSSSIALPQDEDSMMLTLKTIRLIPEAISPLTSPVRMVTKVQPPPPEKQPYIKSLNKDFQNVLAANTSLRAVDVNKENQKCDCSMLPKEDSAPATLAKTDQDCPEEGEIVSDCESEEAAVTVKSPKIKAKESKSTTMKTQQSPRTHLAKEASQKQSVDLQPKFVHKTTTAVANRSPTNRRCFKTVPPPDPKTLPPSSTTVEEIMNMFKVIRSQLRRKYMTLHKNFPMKTFSSVIEMSNLSFTDLVSSLNLTKLCGRESDVKAKLKKIIINVMNKVANNGIVNRIFEQNSDNLKSKLWTFVDGQLDFLFKEIQMALLSASKPLDGKQAPQKDVIDNPAKKTKVIKPLEKSPSRGSTITRKQQEEASIVKAKETPLISTPCTILRPAYQTGLGSRGKNLRMNTEESNEDPSASGSTQEIACHTSEGLPADKSVDRVSTFVCRLSHSGSILDKSEFEILTEQQTSSLTFNLVSDSQMGDIFKSLLQGSDLLENSVSMADNQNWLLGTPKKELSSERNFLTGMMSPTKFGTPSKLMSAWASISPCKFLSPTPKAQMLLNPAVLDESCLLEIPSSPVSSRASQTTAVSLQKTYSILAEDLAVSLTIPSPMKTDSHLSFLNPVNEKTISTPEDGRNAHFSEDAVLDGDDATQHDIHLSLNTDNSSGESSAAQTCDSTDPKVFQFKPHVPKQAVVTERSNDHFIVKIKHTSTVSAIVPTPLAVQSVIPDLAEAPANLATDTVKEPVSHTGQDHRTSEDSPVEKNLIVDPAAEIATSSGKDDLCSSSDTRLNVNLSPVSAVPTEVQQKQAEASKSTCKDEEIKGPQESGNNGQLKRKRKKHHTEPKVKWAKSEMIPDRHHKWNHKKKTKSSTERELKASLKKKSKSTVPSPQLSPQSLSAKNVIRKRGEVVVTWTRDEDRDILIELKTKGPSRDTFSALSEMMNKSPSQIAERFSQLMKLFKKKEKLDCS